MASFNELEGALSAWIASQLTVSASAHTGFDAADREAPCHVCAIAQAVEEPEFSGNYRATCAILAKDIAEAGGGQAALDNEVHNALCDPGLVAGVNAGLTNFRVVMAPAGSIGIARERSQNIWETTYTLDVVVVAVDGSP